MQRVAVASPVREPSCSPDTPMTKGDAALPWNPSGRVEISLSPCTPIAQPCADWMRANLVAVGSRQPSRCGPAGHDEPSALIVQRMLDQMGRILPQQKPPRQQAHCKRPEAIRSTIFAMRQILRGVVLQSFER